MTANGDWLVCPTCSTHIEVGSRCPAMRGSMRCMERVGHDGWHWSDVGAAPALLRWTGAYSVRGCAERLGLSQWCEKPPGHDGAHRNNGLNWTPDPHVGADLGLVPTASSGSSVIDP